MLTSRDCASSSKPPRRPRATQACNLCRQKKYKCEGTVPCSHCKRERPSPDSEQMRDVDLNREGS
ncbi:hypothetical protein BKA80DRAFT_265446 [Phyllosticta citrichinensis]